MPRPGANNHIDPCNLIAHEWPQTSPLNVLGSAYCAVSLLTALLTASSAAAQPPRELDFGVSIRTRFESKQDFDFSEASQDYLLTQTRLHFGRAESADDRWYVELQDSRVSGEDPFAAPPVNENVVPNIFADELDLHQAFWIHQLDNGALTIGR